MMNILSFFIFCCIILMSNALKCSIYSKPIAERNIVPNFTISRGKFFSYKIPSNEYPENVTLYNVIIPGEYSWLKHDVENGILEGIPTYHDIREQNYTLQAFAGCDHIDSVFSVNVVPTTIKDYLTSERCGDDTALRYFEIILDLNALSREQHSWAKIKFIKEFSSLINVNINSLSLLLESIPDHFSHDEVIDVEINTFRQFRDGYVLSWQVGCDNKEWPDLKLSMELAENVTRKGYIPNIRGIEIIGWMYVRKDFIVDFSNRSPRQAKEPAQPVDKKTDDLEEDDEDGDNTDDNYPDSDDDLLDTPPSTDFSSPVYNPTSTSSQHRHHHTTMSKGELSTPVTDKPLNTMINATGDELEDDFDEEHTDYGNGTLIGIPTSSIITPISNNTTNSEIPSTSPTPKLTTTTTTTTSRPIIIESTAVSEKTLDDLKEIQSTPVREPPRVLHKLQPVAASAGKPYKLEIPENTFYDSVDGNTRNLTLVLKGKGDLPTENWIEFDSKNQLIYVLASEVQVSEWKFDVYAYNSADMNISTPLLISVQNSKVTRNVNFEMTLNFDDTKSDNVTGNISLLHNLLQTIAELYSDNTTDYILFRSVKYNPLKLTWTNVTLSTEECEVDRIKSLLAVLTDGEWQTEIKTDVKSKIDSLGVRSENVTWNGIGKCVEVIPIENTPILKSNVNFEPSAKKHIGKITVKVGELLVYRIPEDLFYDLEDISTRNMRLSLHKEDDKDIPSDYWLQLDETNQELYGLPNAADVGTKMYRLDCEDSGGLIGKLMFETEVEKPSKTYYSVEFSMELDIQYKMFEKSPLLKRHLVEKISTLFNDTDPSSVVISGFSPGSLFVTWHNKTLPVNQCPEDTIIRLRQFILKDDEKIQPRVFDIMGSEFQVLSLHMNPIGICEGDLTEQHPFDATSINTNDAAISMISLSNEYFTTFILPLVLIAVMIFLAIIIACVLYKRRSSGKVIIGNGDDRIMLRSRGIPVIFQDEMEEKPEETNKSPVIMKDEKPPLPPPEYHRAASPTTALLSDFDDQGSFRSGRQKQTPIYRKPPPYVSS